LTALVLAARLRRKSATVQTVFVILLENHKLLGVKGSADAPFINGTLLPMASYSEQYYKSARLHRANQIISAGAGTNLWGFGTTMIPLIIT